MTEANPKPIGIVPEQIWHRIVLRERVKELKAAIGRYGKQDLPIDPKWQSELERHNNKLTVILLGEIETTQDFEKILTQTFVTYMGSRRRCAEELKKMAPPEKQAIIEQAMKHLSRTRSWNHTGD